MAPRKPRKLNRLALLRAAKARPPTSEGRSIDYWMKLVTGKSVKANISDGPEAFQLAMQRAIAARENNPFTFMDVNPKKGVHVQIDNLPAEMERPVVRVDVGSRPLFYSQTSHELDWHAGKPFLGRELGIPRKPVQKRPKREMK